jgi:hypothetical protein
MVELWKSIIPGAGLGVFSTKHFKEGEYICYYDGIVFDPETYQDKDYLELDKHLEYDYELAYPDYGSSASIFGYKNPRTDDGIGQFINDAASYEPTGYYAVDTALKQCYIAHSVSMENVVIRGKQVYAKRDISKGEELYFHYGDTYWKGKYARDKLLTILKGMDKVSIYFSPQRKKVDKYLPLYLEALRIRLVDIAPLLCPRIIFQDVHTIDDVEDVIDEYYRKHGMSYIRTLLNE